MSPNTIHNKYGGLYLAVVWLKLPLMIMNSNTNLIYQIKQNINIHIFIHDSYKRLHNEFIRRKERYYFEYIIDEDLTF